MPLPVKVSWDAYPVAGATAQIYPSVTPGAVDKTQPQLATPVDPQTVTATNPVVLQVADTNTQRFAILVTVGGVESAAAFVSVQGVVPPVTNPHQVS